MSDGTKPVSLRQAVKNITALPSMPIIAQKLLALQMDSDEDERKLLMLIEQDPLISAKIIGLANSAAIGSTRTVSSVKDATLLMGITRTHSVSTGIAIMSLSAKAPEGQFNMHDLWLHSFGIAFAMLAIARAMPARIRPKDDQIFLAGMLHDIGYLALAFLDPRRSDKLHSYFASAPDRPSIEIERTILEVCHDELGAELARAWNLPEDIVTVLRYHHSPDVSDAIEHPLTRMINITEKLLPHFGISEFAGSGVSDDEWEALGIDPFRAEEIEDQVAEQAAQAMQFVSSFT
jgi:HD-like signal output (HDOD) protein